MKAYINLKNVQILFLSIALVVPVFTLQAQDKQYKARLSVDYIHVMGAKPYLEVASKFKGENGYEPSTKLELNIYHRVNEDSIILLGTAKTNHKGVAVYELEEQANSDADSLTENTFVVKIENSKRFKNAKKEISYMDASIKAEIVEIDSVFNIKATLLNGIGEPIEGEKFKINLQRLFAPLAIGRSYNTSGKGKILVPLNESYPGVDGRLTFEVFIDSKKYGNVKYLLNSSIGEPIKDLSSFDDRTLWSPPNKTPLFLLIFPNLLMLGIWFVIFLLVRNLFKIYKA